MRRAADQRVYLVTGNGCVLRYMYSWVAHVQMILCVMSLANRAGIQVFLKTLRLIYCSWYVHRNKHAVGKDVCKHTIVKVQLMLGGKVGNMVKFILHLNLVKNCPLRQEKSV